MKKVLYGLSFYCLSLANIALATDSEAAQNLPWEHAILILQQSLFYLGGLLVLIGLMWAGYGFVAQQEKEAGFKRIIGTIIGGSIIFGAKAIVSTLFGATF